MKDVAPAPEGTCPLLISMREMETLGLKTGSGLRETVDFKVLSRAEVVKQIAQMGFMSPFHARRNEIAKMATGDDLVIVADREETYGENWLLCLTHQAIEAQMAALKRRETDRLDAQMETVDDAAEVVDVATIVYEDRPIRARPWTSATVHETHEDVEALTVTPSRPLMTIAVTKMADGLNAEYKFSDRDADQCFVEWRQHKDPNYELIRLEQDVGLQSTPPLVDHSTQTSWFRSVNSALQYESIRMPPASCRAEMDSDKVQEFLARVLPQVERVLQQNETLDVFLDPFAHLLKEEDALLGNKTHENVMRELRSFTDLVYSKNKTLPAIDWHPKRHGVLAVAAAANASFAKRLDLLDTVESSYILIWNFVDLIHPQIMLESPQDVMTMRFNPAAPHLVAAGLYNGQVLVWDFSKLEYMLSKIKTPQNPSESDANGPSPSKSGRDDTPKVAPMQPLYVSYIDVSHRRPVADLQWLPAGVEVTSRGHIVASTSSDTVNQFVTIAADGHVSFWDLRFKDPKYRNMTRAKVDKSGSKDSGTDVHFVPIYSISLTKPDGPGELTLQTLWLEKTREESATGETVVSLTSKFYCGTEEGEFVYADWRPHALANGSGNKADESGRGRDDGGVEYVQWLCRDHSRPILGLCASPFFPNIFLTASESYFHLWNVLLHVDESVKSPSRARNGPIFVSPLTQSTITCVAFSPSRPGVLFLGKADGMLEVWDFMDQSHRLSLSIGVTACALTSIEFRPQVVLLPTNQLSSNASANTAGVVPGRAKAPDSATGARDRAIGQVAPLNATTNLKQQLVAVGDQMGNLHILEVPRTLSRPTSGERGAMESYFKRESDRTRAARDALRPEGVVKLHQTRGEVVASLGTEAAENESSLTGKDAEATIAGSLESADDVFKRMESEFCRDMGLDIARSA